MIHSIYIYISIIHTMNKQKMFIFIFSLSTKQMDWLVFVSTSSQPLFSAAKKSPAVGFFPSHVSWLPRCATYRLTTGTLAPLPVAWVVGRYVVQETVPKKRWTPWLSVCDMMVGPMVCVAHMFQLFLSLSLSLFLPTYIYIYNDI